MPNSARYDYKVGGSASTPGICYSGGITAVYSDQLERASIKLHELSESYSQVLWRLRGAVARLDNLSCGIQVLRGGRGSNISVAMEGTGESALTRIATGLDMLSSGLSAAAEAYRAEEALVTQKFSTYVVDGLGRGMCVAAEDPNLGGYWTTEKIGSAAQGLFSLGSERGYQGSFQDARDAEFRPGFSTAQLDVPPVMRVGEVLTSPLSNIVQGTIHSARQSTKSVMAVNLLEVQAITGPAYIVSVGGTQDTGFGVTSLNPQDARNMGLEFKGLDSDAAQGIREAIQTNVPLGAKLVLAGHSQGGTIMQTLSADPGLAGYDIKAVTTFGAPPASAQRQLEANAVPTLVIKNADDPVPQLGGNLADRPNTTNLTSHLVNPDDIAVNDAMLAESSMLHDLIVGHDMRRYERTVTQVVNDPNPRAAAALGAVGFLVGAKVVSEKTLNVHRVRLTDAEKRERIRAKQDAQRARVTNAKREAIGMGR